MGAFYVPKSAQIHGTAPPTATTSSNPIPNHAFPVARRSSHQRQGHSRLGRWIDQLELPIHAKRLLLCNGFGRQRTVLRSSKRRQHSWQKGLHLYRRGGTNNTVEITDTLVVLNDLSGTGENPGTASTSTSKGASKPSATPESIPGVSGAGVRGEDTSPAGNAAVSGSGTASGTTPAGYGLIRFHSGWKFVKQKRCF